MYIIDTHTHHGRSNLSGWLVSGEQLLETMEAHGIDASLVMPHAVTDDARAEHDMVAALCQRHPDRFFGIANLSPVRPDSEYRGEIKRCVQDLGFVAVKLNPMQHLTSPLMSNADKVFAISAELDVPVIVHTGLGSPWALPALSIPRAQAYPDLPIVLAHAGSAQYAADAYVAALVCPNIYLEPSWCPVTEVRRWVKSIGAKRLMFGSDNPFNAPVELAKYRALDLSEEDLAWCLGRTANQVYKLGLE